MAKAQDPPSPVDAYVAPAPPVPAGESAPQQFTSMPPYYAPQPGAAQPRYYSSPRATNTLAIIALIASCAGLLVPLADIAGVVMGFIALNQIKRTGENGHGMALAAVIVGFAVFFLELLVVAAYFVFLFWIIGISASAATFGGD
ncbi:MAG TPA: DUF4190 domain-containing protein [Galbitalea sp.]|jgi:hypothetical protein|nr:DUF4190 domain-containing protein [Galbitalea sp.]